jgi:hypothetical protein
VVWPQNHSDGFRWFGLKTSGDGFLQFGLKTGGDGFSGLASKPAIGFLVEPQNQGGGGFPSLGLKTDNYGFGDLCLKITEMVSWFGPQNRRREVSARNASRSSGLLGVETSLARVSQSGLKIGGGATTGGARGTIAEVASEAS